MICVYIIAVVVCLVAYIYYRCSERHKYWERKGIKYIKPQMLLGSFKLFQNKSLIELAQDMYKQFPDERYHGIYLFLEPGLIVKDADLIKEITIKHFDHFTDHRTYVPPEVDPFWDRNLFATTGEKWHSMRATLSPSFTSSKMKLMFGLMEECAQHFVEYFKNQESDNDIIELELKDAFSRMTNDVIATTAFGVKCDSLRDRTNEFYMMGKDMTNFNGIRGLKFFFSALSPQLSKLLSIRIIPKHLAEYFSNIITETVKLREENKTVRPDMIYLLMQAKKEFEERHENTADDVNLSPKSKREVTTDDIISQAFIFFFAGFDTVSTALTFITYEIAIHPDVQNRLRREFEKISGKLTYEDLVGLKYLDMVVSEGLRKWPVAVTSDRKVTKPFTIEPVRPDEKQLRLEVGDTIAFLLFGIHHDPKFYPEPKKFDPERFSDQNKHNINPSVYIPFGSGPRICIGNRFALMEIKLIIFYLLKSFEIVTVEKTKIPLVLDPKQLAPTCQGGMWLGFKKIRA